MASPGSRPTLPSASALLGGGLAIYAYGTVGYVLFGYGVVDAIYQTGLTLTTVGFTTYEDPSIAEKLFTTSVALIGVLLYLVVLAVIASLLTEGGVVTAARARRMQHRIDRLRGHVVVCAYGRVGRAVTRELAAEEVPVVVVDPGEVAIARMRRDRVLHISDDPSDENVLRAAGVERARALITAVDSDATNVFITMTGRSLHPDLFVVARASEPESPERLYRAGANRVISPYVSSGRHMAMLALRPRVTDYLDMAGLGEGALRIEEVRVDERSAGATVGGLSLGGIPLLLRTGDGAMHASPEAETTLRAGDVLVLLHERSGESEGR